MAAQKRGELWHFQIFQGGMRRQRQYRQHVAPLVVQAIRILPPEVWRRNRQHAVLLAEQAISETNIKLFVVKQT